jgi:GTPase SAR1 family protein
VYDTCNRKSFESIPVWMDQITSQSSNMCVVLVGNKTDVDSEKVSVLYPVFYHGY